jgi:hypothetical protein
MSIEDLIAAAEQDGKLFRFVPARTRRPTQRRAFLSCAAKEEIINANSALSLFRGAGFVEAALTRWVIGDRIYKGFLKRLRPPPAEIWEIRITQPTPQWRMFMRFACADTVVISKTYSRGLLGKEGSKAWTDAMGECDACWKATFGDVTPYVMGNRAAEYVTENCDDFKI